MRDADDGGATRYDLLPVRAEAPSWIPHQVRDDNEKEGRPVRNFGVWHYGQATSAFSASLASQSGGRRISLVIRHGGKPQEGR